MSGSFTGFSEDDIRKLAKTNPAKEKVNSVVVGNNKQTKPVLNPQKRPSNNNHHHQSSDEIRNKILNEKILNSQYYVEPILESAKLSKPPQLDNNQTQHTEEKVDNIQLDNTAKNSNLNKVVESEASTATTQSKSNNENEINKDKEVVLVERKLDLAEFQAKQKLIEEQNRKRKEILIKALAVKTKQTQEETQRLNKIREEFKKLDALLSNDVKFLRKQIEVASLDYMEAQKRYFRIEKEFLESKLYLHQKLERKEMLTEHLCTIIEKNEERKAEKLNELLSKLNLKPDLQNEINKKDDDINEIGDNPKQTDDNIQLTDDNVVKSENLEKQ